MKCILSPFQNVKRELKTKSMGDEDTYNFLKNK